MPTFKHSYSVSRTSSNQLIFNLQKAKAKHIMLMKINKSCSIILNYISPSHGTRLETSSVKQLFALAGLPASVVFIVTFGF